MHPIDHGNVTVLENGPDRGVKLLPAGVALQRADFGALAVQPSAAAHRPTFGASNAIRPHDAFQLLNGGGFNMEDRSGENRHGHHLSMAAI